MSKSPVWLIGLDGATFDILQPIIEAGKLPVIADLIKKGASGILKSSVAPSTPQAWASVITGNNPGKHGVFGFLKQLPGQPREFFNLKSIKGERIWTWFGRAGRSSLVVNVPLTYPPEPLQGIMITGMMTPSTKNEFTYPSSLKNRILSDYPGFRLDVAAGIDRSRSPKILDELEAALEARMRLVMSLIKEHSPDFLFLVFVLPDRIQHTFCRYIHPKSPIYETKEAREWRSRIWESYTQLDQAIGRLLSIAPAGTTTLLISDHGFTMEQGGFYTNDFLSELGMLTFNMSSGRVTTRGLIRKLNIPKVKKLVPNRWLKKAVNLTKSAIEWPKTQAYASPPPQSGIFINLVGRGSEGVVPVRDYDKVREAILIALDEVKHPDTGLAVVKSYRREDIFFGPHIENIPDVLLNFEQSAVEAKDVVLGGRFMTWSDGGSRGIHHRDGIFIGTGPAIKPGKIDGLSLKDIAPNVLELAGVNNGRRLDGDLRPDIFRLNISEEAKTNT